MTSILNGGAIPEIGDYKVVADPDDVTVGTVGEDWAIESMAGDVFLLGTTSWQIRRVETGVVRVRDAGGAPPTVPFWLGEAPARSAELSRELSALREEVSRQLVAGGSAVASAALAARAGLDAAGAAQVVAYLDASHTALGALPSQRRIVVERFFDESGGMQLVAHAPFGGRINRALGLVARKRICRAFDFELQAAASDDAFVLSLGPQHSFPLETTASLVRSHDLRETLEQAVLLSPMFTARWRWNLGRSLAVLRFRGGRRNPPPIQRMEADDLLAAIFPGLAQCQENNAGGPIELPDHPVVRQTMHDCLHEALDVDGAIAVALAVERGEILLHLRDTSEPSPLSHEILNGKPYTFLDDAPLEERRTRAVSLRRGLPVAARDLAVLDAAAVALVRQQAAIAPRDADELHDALLSLVVLRPEPAFTHWFAELAAAGRVAEIDGFWVATERRDDAHKMWGDEDAEITEALRGHLAVTGPATVAELAARTGLRDSQVERGIAALEATGYALRGSFDPARSEPEVCARHLLARIHGYTQKRLRSEIEPVSARDFMRFLLRWQCVAPGTRREGRAGSLAAIRQLQGFELAAGAWETAVLPARVAEYRSSWLDDLCWSGDVVWGRFSLRGGRVSSRAAPIALAQRADLPWLLAALRGPATPELPESEAGRAVLAALERGGALFSTELAARAGIDAASLAPALWELVAGGHITSDGISALRQLFDGRAQTIRRGARVSRPGRAVQGRWAILAAPPPEESDAHAEQVAQQLLTRWGVVFYDVLARENLALSWREILLALRRLEARGVARGGRFVTGFTGEQYAWPGAVDALRAVRRMPCTGERVVLSAADPLNLVGILTPGARVPAGGTEPVTWCDGEPVDREAASA
jgi:ATP-dependent Lhr-like helicase